jgi:hypothetical protein
MKIQEHQWISHAMQLPRGIRFQSRDLAIVLKRLARLCFPDNRIDCEAAK